MKKILVVLIVMLTAGCAGTGGMLSSGSSSGAGSNGTDSIYRPNFSPAYERMDSSFHLYFGG